MHGFKQISCMKALRGKKITLKPAISCLVVSANIYEKTIVIYIMI